MNHGCVTLDEVFAAAALRAASLVPETSGYLALAVCDATSRLPFVVDDRLVMLTTEGNVGITRRGEVIPARQAVQNLRATLARLLTVATGTSMPSLTATARPREESDRGLDGLVEEIEAALIPVNRSAARRALARLARETIKAKENGRLKRAAAPRPAPRPAPPPAPLPSFAPPEGFVLPKPPPPEPVAPPEPVPVVVAPQPAILRELDHLAAGGTTPPPGELHEPTPTVLGMAPVEIPEVDLHLDMDSAKAPAVEPVVAAAPAPPPPPSSLTPPIEVELSFPTPEPSALPESTVLAQPTEDPALAFGRPEPLVSLPGVASPPRIEPSVIVTAPAAPPPPAAPLPAPPAAPPPAVATPAPAVVAPAPPRRPPPPPRGGARYAAPLPAAVACPSVWDMLRPVPPAREPTRADDLLAHFGASCVDDDTMREAAACLRHIAGLDPTAPPSRVEIHRQEAPPRPLPAPVPARIPLAREDLDAPEGSRRRGLGLTSAVLMLAVLLVGLAGGGAAAWIVPELFHTLARSVSGAPEAEPPAAPRPIPPPAQPAQVAPPVEPAPPPPVWSDRLGGTRAERGSEQRAR